MIGIARPAETRALGSFRKLAGVLAALPLGIGSAGCSSVAPPASAPHSPISAELLAVDQAFAAVAGRVGVDAAFAEFAAPDATLLPQNELPVRGRDAIRGATRVPDGVVLTWQPEAADVAASGELGWTWGFYQVRATGADGQPVVRNGKYVTIWRRQPDGAWRYVLDIGNPNSPPGS